jgi:hypothetical protein
MNRNLQCLKIIRKSSLIEIEISFGESGTRDKDTLNWYLGEIICDTAFLKLHTWVNNSTLDNLLNNYNGIEEPDNYFQYIPLTIRQIVKEDIRVSNIISPYDFSFWLEDGLHRSIASGDLLKRGEIKFHSIPIYYGARIALENNKVYTLNELFKN